MLEYSTLGLSPRKEWWLVLNAVKSLARRMFRKAGRPAPRRERRFRPVVEGLEARECPATIDWVGGVSTAWNNSANWYVSSGTDENGVPDSDDIAYMTWSTGKYAPTISDDNYTISSMVFDANWDDGGTKRVTLADGFDLTITNNLNGGSAYFEFDLKDKHASDEPELITHDATISHGANFFSTGTAYDPKVRIGNGAAGTWTVGGDGNVLFNTDLVIRGGGAGSMAVVDINSFSSSDYSVLISPQDSVLSAESQIRMEQYSRIDLDGTSGRVAVEQVPDYASSNVIGDSAIEMVSDTAEIVRDTAGEAIFKIRVDADDGVVSLSNGSTVTFTPSGSDGGGYKLVDMVSVNVSIERGSTLKTTSSTDMYFSNCVFTVPTSAGSDGDSAYVTSTAGDVVLASCVIDLKYTGTSNYSTLEFSPAGSTDDVKMTGTTVNVNCIDGTSGVGRSKVKVNGDLDLSGGTNSIYGWGVNTGNDPDGEQFDVFEYTGGLAGAWTNATEGAGTPGTLVPTWPKWTSKKFYYQWA
jgi:hypothetical protein